MPPAQYFVVNHEGEWKIKSGYRHSLAYPSKSDAIDAAIELAERDGQAGRDAEVLVQGEDRLFQTEWVYGRDPYPANFT